MSVTTESCNTLTIEEAALVLGISRTLTYEGAGSSYLVRGYRYSKSDGASSSRVLSESGCSPRRRCQRRTRPSDERGHKPKHRGGLRGSGALNIRSGQRNGSTKPVRSSWPVRSRVVRPGSSASLAPSPTRRRVSRRNPRVAPALTREYRGRTEAARTVQPHAAGAGLRYPS